MTLSLLLLACTSTDGAPPGDSPDPADDTADDTGDTDTDTDTDTDDPLPLDVEITGVTAEVDADVATVVKVTWTTSEPTEGWVEFGEGAVYTWSTPVHEATTEHEALLLGLPGDTEAHFRVAARVGEAEARSDDQSVTTGSVPNVLPHMTVSGTLDGWMVVPFLGTAFGLVVVDGQGRIVWYRLADGTSPFQTRVYLAADGTGFLSNDYSATEGGIVRTTFEGDATTESLPGMRHDLVELPDGTIGAVVADTRTFGDDATEGTGDAIVEVAADGTQTTIWSVWDDFSPEEICPDLSCAEDWSHANALDYDAVEDAYYINLHRIGGILKIDRATGTLEWVMSGDFSDFTFVGDAPEFELSHQFHFVEDELFVFNNGNYGSPSSVDAYLVDYDAKTLTLEWTYEPDPEVDVTALGAVDLLDDGSVVANWGDAGMIQLLSPEREVEWQMVTELGYGFGYSAYTRDLYGR